MTQEDIILKFRIDELEECLDLIEDEISDKINQINAWADDLIESTQLHVEEMRTQRKELQRQSDMAVNMVEKEKKPSLNLTANFRPE